MKPIDLPHKFLIDRSLGNNLVTNAFRKFGLEASSLADIFGHKKAEDLEDIFLFDYCSKNNLILVMKDKKILRRPHELSAIKASKAKIFVLHKAQLSGKVQVEYFNNNFEEIIKHSSDKGPFVYFVAKSGLSENKIK